MIFGMKQLNTGKKELIEISLAKETYKNKKVRYLIVIKSNNRYGLSLKTFQEVLDIFLGNYIIYAQSLYSEKLEKKGFHDFFTDKKGHAILAKGELKEIFSNDIAEQYYFIPFKYNSLTSDIYEIIEERVSLVEGLKNVNLSLNHFLAWSEWPWDYIAFVYIALEDYYNALIKLPSLIKYLIDQCIY